MASTESVFDNTKLGKKKKKDILICDCIDCQYKCHSKAVMCGSISQREKQTIITHSTIKVKSLKW